MRKLATVEKVVAVTPIPGADFIEAVQVKGWTCVAKKGEFAVGDFGVYFEIDSIPPDSPVFSFLWAPHIERPKSFRLQTRRFRKVLSQGLMMSFSAIGIDGRPFEEGDDLTDMLGVVKYDPPEVEEDEPGAMVKKGPRTVGRWPGLAPHTEESRMQNLRLDRFAGLPFTVTRKLDGTSSTYGWGKRPMLEGLTKQLQRSRWAVVRQLARVLPYVDIFLPFVSYFYSCSRNLAVGPGTVYGQMAEKYQIAQKLKELGLQHLVIQGEIVGPKIQKNPRNLPSPQLFVFNVFDQKRQMYLSVTEAMQVCQRLSLDFVPIVYQGGSFDPNSGWLLELAEGLCPGTSNEEEGIVVNFLPDPNVQYGRVSFKVISNRYLLNQKGG